MRTFEYRDAKSAKFWNIELQGKSYTVTYGRLGAAGQTQTKDFPTEEKAKAAHDKLIAEKTSKGYTETTCGGDTGPSPGAVLERAIVENPDDVAAFAAYGDWLTQQGDPHGEFIQVQLLLEDESRPAKDRKQMQKQEQKLLEAHQRQWIGNLAAYLIDQHGTNEHHGTNEFRFARGWLDSLRIPMLNVGLARAMKKAPQLRLLRELAIEQIAYGTESAGDDADEDEPEGDYPALTMLERCPYLGNVRVFRLGDVERARHDDHPSCFTSGDNAAELVKAMPRLEELILHAHRVDQEKLFKLKTLPNLRIMQVYHCHRCPLEVLAANAAYGKLTHLLIFPHGLEFDEEPYINLAGVRAIVRSKHLTSLTHLRLRNSDMGDAGVAEIVQSNILKRLKMLDLRHGRITDEGVRLLAACPDLKNLELLELSSNHLTAAGIQALRATGVNFRADGQRPGAAEDEDFYFGDAE